MTFSADSVLDTTGIVVLAISTGVQAATYIADTNLPAILDDQSSGFPALSLSTGEIVITFNETINRTSFDVSKLVLASDLSDLFPGISYVNISEANISNSADSTIMVIVLSTADLNLVKANDGLCTRRRDCYLKVAEGMFTDMSGNALIDTSTSTGQLYQARLT